MATRKTTTQPDEVITTTDPTDSEPTVATMASMFGGPKTVDEVVQVPMTAPTSGGIIIRPARDIEQMTVGDEMFNFKGGVRYRVPERVAQILFDRDLLMEFPTKA